VPVIARARSHAHRKAVDNHWHRDVQLASEAFKLCNSNFKKFKKFKLLICRQTVLQTPQRPGSKKRAARSKNIAQNSNRELHLHRRRHAPTPYSTTIRVRRAHDRDLHFLGFLHARRRQVIARVVALNRIDQADLATRRAQLEGWPASLSLPRCLRSRPLLSASMFRCPCHSPLPTAWSPAATHLAWCALGTAMAVPTQTRE